MPIVRLGDEIQPADRLLSCANTPTEYMTPQGGPGCLDFVRHAFGELRRLREGDAGAARQLAPGVPRVRWLQFRLRVRDDGRGIDRAVLSGQGSGDTTA